MKAEQIQTALPKVTLHPDHSMYHTIKECLKEHLLWLSVITITAAIACVEPEPGVEVDGATECPLGRVDVWVRVWRDGTEISCREAVAAGFALEAATLPDRHPLTVEPGWCGDLQPESHRAGTGVWTILDVPPLRHLVVWNPQGGVEHSTPSTPCGTHGTHTISVVLP